MYNHKCIYLGFVAFCLLSLWGPLAAFGQTGCAAPWNSTSIYTSGMTASVNGVNYKANFWTQNQNPTTNNGGAGSGQPWTSTGSCSGSGGGSGSGSGCAAPWSSTAVYTAGMTASFNGANYTANFWTQNQNPSTNNGGAGSGAPWTATGVCAPCSTVPAAPANLTASSTTACGTSLSWSAVAAPANCTLTGYTVFRNGTSVGTTSGTTFSASGLSPSTKYSFGVAATDAAGASGQSAVISVTTAAGSCTVSQGGHMFAPYIDMGLTVGEQLVTIQQQSGIQRFTLGFVVSGGSGCTPVWGGNGATVANDTLANGTTMLSLVQGVRSAGADVIISFGGAFGTELAANTGCATASQLQAAYQAVINKYSVNSSTPVMLDFDIEGGAVDSPVRGDGINSVDLRNQALTALVAANPGLKISLTLPVLPTGLIQSGVNVLTSAANNHTPVGVVNVMAMDYGSANDNGGQMGLSATQAASNVHTQIQSAGLTATVGITPMIGVNDTNTEIFQLADATMLLNFANQNSYITRLSMWSVARDNGGCAGSGFASATCSSITQNNWDFSHIFEAFH
jgi:chitodextrinase